jgi:hypothetical protein
MKKLLSILFLCCFSVVLFAQTFVSTTPSNRNAILDDYTGKGCGNCPAAHRVANQIMAANPNRVFTLTIHEGTYANPVKWGYPDFTTAYGDALMQLAGPPTGYPCGSVNRQAFTGVTPTGSFLYNAGQWSNLCNGALNEPSYVNIAAEGTIDWATRKLALTVEVYYTANYTGTNKLNVVMLQNEIISWQGSANAYPEMMIGQMVGNFGLYRNQHVVRTSLGGETIPTTTSGTFWSKTYEYDIPDFVKDVEVALEDIEFIAYISEGNHKIITGVKASATPVNQPAIAARIPYSEELRVHNCSGDAKAYAMVKNLSANPLTSLELTYTVSGTSPKTYVWNKRIIAPMANDTVHLPIFQVQKNLPQNVEIKISKVNNQAYSSLSSTVSIFKEVPNGEFGMNFLLATDRYAEQTTFKIFNPDGTVLLEGGPWENCAYICVTPRYFHFIPIMPGCHRIEVYDSEGDGINGGSGNGYIKLFGATGNELWYNNGLFGRQATASVDVTEIGAVHVITASIRDKPNGEISPKGTLYFKENTDVVFTFTPNSGYIVKEVFIDSVLVVNSEALLSYTIPNVKKDHKIEVSFKVGTQPPPSVKDINGVTISIAPNPVNAQLFVTGLYDKLEIISITGQVVTTVNNYKPSVDVTLLAKGFYFVKIYTNNNATIFKIIK